VLAFDCSFKKTKLGKISTAATKAPNQEGALMKNFGYLLKYQIWFFVSRKRRKACYFSFLGLRKLDIGYSVWKRSLVFREAGHWIFLFL
jgi:hypothetical protein